MDPNSFTTDLNQLADAADVQLPHLVDLLQRQRVAIGQLAGISQDAMFASPDSAFYELTQLLRDRGQRACDVLAATSQALHDIAVCYMRADGRV